jgi:hypothetical protein
MPRRTLRLACAIEVSAILSMLRALSRTYSCAIALVHHARKGTGDEPGQALRGSSDFYAWADSLLHLRRAREGLVLAIEHRAAASLPPVALALVTDDGPVRLEVRAMPAPPAEPPLAERIVRALQNGGPHRHRELRETLRVRDQHLSDTLRELELSGLIARAENGWRAAVDP